MIQTITISLPKQRKIESNPTLLALIAIFTAIVALSLAAIFIRLSERELGPFATIFNRFWIASLFLGLLQIINRAGLSEKTPSNDSQLDYTARDFLLLIASGIMFWGCLASWAWSLTQTGVANSTILHNLTPLFTTLGVWLLFGQRFDRRFLVGLSLAMIGAMALGLDDLYLGADNFIGDVAALLSAVFSAGNLMLIEKLRNKFAATTIILWCCVVGAIVSFPIVLLTEQRLFPISWSGWLAVLGLAIVCQIIGQCLQAYSLKNLSSGLIGIFLLLDPVLAALIAWVIFSESLSLFNWLAFCVVLLGIYLAKSSRYAQVVMATEIE
ncbi:MAG: DMT family transporter [Okeania sp. SIO2D1]|nr:DMT family transporter [Okeania sp. SIO2D1]